VGMGSKKPRNASPRGGGPISPKVLLALRIELFACELAAVPC
jgi:hypothetical protein